MFFLGFGGFFGGQRMVQAEPGPIIGPIAAVFGLIIDVIFEMVYNLTIYHSLGISIVLLTLIVRALMLPLAIKSQKSMMAMQLLAPEMTKIKNKYPKKDAESQQKMNAEIQKLYADNKVNPFGGCLPLIIQMPMFFGLSFIMNQSYLYVSRLGALYSQMSQYMIEWARSSPANTDYFHNAMNAIAVPITPDRMIANQELVLFHVPDVNRILNAFGPYQWEALFAWMPQLQPQLQVWLDQKMAMEIFFGMSLTAAAGLGWPGIMIPILAVSTAIVTSKLMQQMTVATDERARAQQKMMMIVMPIMMGVMTIGMPAGVGIFWITSSVFQIGQQAVLNKKMGAKKAEA